MRINQETYGNFFDTLHQSRQGMLELGSFGLYRPNEDRILHTIRPSNLPRGAITERTPTGLNFDDGLKSEIAAFNRGRKKHVEIGPYKYNRGDGKVFGYHTHPADDQEVVPGQDDTKHMHDIGSPLEVILAGALLEHLPYLPFLVCYNTDYFPEGKMDFTKMDIPNLVAEETGGIRIPAEIDFTKIGVFNKIIERAAGMKIPIDILSQLAFLQHYTGLKASLNVATI